MKAINDHIENVRHKIKQAYRQLEEGNQFFTVAGIKALYLGGHHSQRNKQYTLLKLIDKHETECGPHLAAGTMKNYLATRLYVANFIRYKYDLDDIHVSMLDFAFITELENYIPLYPLKSQNPCKGNGTARHIERIKKMVSWAKLLGWIKEDPFKDFSPHKKTQIARACKN